MNSAAKMFFGIGAFSGFTAVALGAYGAHALRTKLDAPMLAVFETGVRYQFYHALALMIAAWAVIYFQHRLILAGGWFFIAGTVLFSGSLYALALSGYKTLGAVTPLGGLCFLAGWVCAGLGVLKSRI